MTRRGGCCLCSLFHLTELASRDSISDMCVHVSSTSRCPMWQTHVANLASQCLSGLFCKSPRLAQLQRVGLVNANALSMKMLTVELLTASICSGQARHSLLQLEGAVVVILEEVVVVLCHIHGDLICGSARRSLPRLSSHHRICEHGVAACRLLPAHVR